MGGWWNQEVNSPPIAGGKDAHSGLGGTVMERLGVNVQKPGRGAKSFQALQLGTIDAAEWVGPLPMTKS